MAKQKFFTQGQMEAAISESITRFEKEFIGRGPLETRTQIVDDLVVVRLKGILTKAEIQLVKSDRNARGRDLIKQMRIELIESGRALLETIIRNITKRRVRSLHCDISTTFGEKVLLFVLEKSPVLEE